MGSCDGLVLFQKSRESLFRSDFFVCNPVTRQGARLDLKPPSCPDVARLCGFYRHGPSGEHRLLVLANEPAPGLPAHYVYSLAAAVTASSQLPRCLGPVADGVVVDEFAYFIDHYAHHRGKIHWTIHPLARSAEKILAFDTVSEDFRLISRPPWPRDHYRDDDLCLLELDGRLAVTATELHGDSVELWVLEEYDDKQSWSHRFRIVLPVPPNDHVSP
uniref:F-box associated beta-propeller type 3 domain-containing protein n=1 Tax=Triticum urartu TaxID=4572 RepID=A0A8R7UC95_TRIUA